MSKRTQNTMIDESTAYLEARLIALEKCHALLAYIESVVMEPDRHSYASVEERDVYSAVRMRIQAEQGRTWSTMSMWSPLSDRASALVKQKLRMYTDKHISYSMEHLLPYSMRNSTTAREELVKELDDMLNKKVDPSKEETVEVQVPKRAIDKEL